MTSASMTAGEETPKSSDPTAQALTLEDFYAAVAEAIDAVGPQRETLMLAKLALLLAHELGDAARATALVEQAQLDLD